MKIRMAVLTAVALAMSAPAGADDTKGGAAPPPAPQPAKPGGEAAKPNQPAQKPTDGAVAEVGKTALQVLPRGKRLSARGALWLGLVGAEEDMAAAVVVAVFAGEAAQFVGGVRRGMNLIAPYGKSRSSNIRSYCPIHYASASRCRERYEGRVSATEHWIMHRHS